MADVKWIKLDVGIFDDEKIKIIQAMPDGDALLIVWIKLIALAGKTNDGGYIYISENIPYTEEMLSSIMNKPINTIRLAMQTFISLGMVENDSKGIYLINFEKHQSLDKLEKIKEQDRERQRLQRARRKELASRDSHVTVTVQSRDESRSVTQQKKNKKKDIDSDVVEVVDDSDEFDNDDYDNKLKYFNRNIILSDNQLEHLLNIMGLEVFDEYTARLSKFIDKNGAKIKSHYDTILKWYDEDRKVKA